MKPFLFLSVDEDGSWSAYRKTLNQAIEEVNTWTRAGQQESQKDLVLAEVDLVRRALTASDRCGDWYFETLDQLVAYVMEGTIPESEINFNDRS